MDTGSNVYWTQEHMAREAVGQIVHTTNALMYAFGCDSDISFPEILKWLVDLKIKIINSNMCKYCNYDTDTCKCKTICVKCNTTEHTSCHCEKHIMNAPLFKIIFSSSKVKEQIS